MQPGARDRTKLPKWAQHEIERLERDVAHYKAKLSAGPEDSNTFADPYGTPRPLGRDTSIEFRVGEFPRRFRARLQGEELVVDGGDGVLVQPWATNVVRLRLGR